jgi:hypothetical protein
MNHSVHCGLIVSIMDTITPSWTVSVLHGLYDMVPSWTLWPWVYQYHGHYGYIVECGRYGPIVDPTGSSWTPMGSSWTLWVHHGHYGSIMDNMGPSWTLWVHHGHYMSIMDAMDYRSIMDTMAMGPSASWNYGHGSIMDTVSLSWTIWVHRGRYGFIRDTIGP